MHNNFPCQCAASYVGGPPSRDHSTSFGGLDQALSPIYPGSQSRIPIAEVGAVERAVLAVMGVKFWPKLQGSFFCGSAVTLLLGIRWHW